ncbi:UDP-N-acetylmuramate dehydrogenase [Candidatus Saccharibacteria bacterium]|nr:UDP-N-acetylmuramate dehydrogenase [Candidatus Saccharibacteria bacterium]
MRLGGPARYVIEIENPQEIRDAYEFARQYQLPAFALGYGANTIGHDEGFNGVIIINRMRGIISESITDHDTRIKIMGGEYWDDVVAYACKQGLTGIEAMSKIPGLASAAPVQNIGAYDQQISDVLESIEAYDSTTGTFVTLKKADLQFSYRQSILNTTARGRYFILSITLVLSKGVMPQPFYYSIEKYADNHNLTDFTPEGIRNIVTMIRTSKLPDPLTTASSGSFFHNIYLSESQAEIAANKGLPIRRTKDGFKLSTAWLIEQCGLKGKLIHGIRVSDQAPLVLINESAKSFKDLAKARGEIVSKVYDKFGYWLEQEPVEIQ